MKDIEAKDINIAQSRASSRAIELNKALGLSYYVVKEGKLYEVSPAGVHRLMRPSVFGSRRVEKKRIQVKSKHAR